MGRLCAAKLASKRGRPSDAAGCQREVVLVSVPEAELELQLFLRACGFLACQIERGPAAGEDHYQFTLRAGWFEAATL